MLRLFTIWRAWITRVTIRRIIYTKFYFMSYTERPKNIFGVSKKIRDFYDSILWVYMSIYFFFIFHAYHYEILFKNYLCQYMCAASQIIKTKELYSIKRNALYIKSMVLLGNNNFPQQPICITIFLIETTA